MRLATTFGLMMLGAVSAGAEPAIVPSAPRNIESKIFLKNAATHCAGILAAVTWVNHHERERPFRIWLRNGRCRFISRDQLKPRERRDHQEQSDPRKGATDLFTLLYFSPQHTQRIAS